MDPAGAGAGEDNSPVAHLPPQHKDKKAAKMKPKKRGALHLLRVALFMLRRKNRKVGPLPIDVVSPARKGMWKSLMASIRPLHLDHSGNRSPPAIMNTPTQLPDSFHDVASPPPSSPSSSSVDPMSRYASAEDLRQLDSTSTSDTEPDDDELDGDHTIDVLAEEFIAKFYEQIRLQRLASVARARDDSPAGPF